MNATTFNDVATVYVGCPAYGVAFDPVTNQIFVTTSTNVTVVSAATDTVQYSLGVPGGAVGIVYDSAKNEMFVTGNQLYVAVISASSDTISAEIALGPDGTFLNGTVPAYDSALGEIFVPIWQGGNVSVISDATNRVVAKISVGGSPRSAVWDPGKDEVFVAPTGSNDVSIISTATNSVVAKFNVSGHPLGLAYNPLLNEVLVGNQLSRGYHNLTTEVDAISDSTNRRVAQWPIGPNPPTSLLYYPATREVFAASSWSGNLSVLGNGYSARFVENGLAFNSTWWVTAGNRSIESNTTRIPLTAVNGTLSFAVSAQGPYNVTPTSGSFDVRGNSTRTEINFSAAFYQILFQENGLPADKSWTVNLSGTDHTSTTRNITFYRSNGSYRFTVNSSSPGYLWNPAVGLVNVTEGPINLTISATPVFSVEFVESGLPLGTEWLVTLGSATNSSSGTEIGFEMPNGTYSFRVPPLTSFGLTPSAGMAEVRGAPLVFTLEAFRTYAVTFEESGLPTRTSWSVTLGGVSEATTSSSATFREANGTYSFKVGPSPGYSGTPPDGSVTVAGLAQSVSINFTISVYTLSFHETGLPTGTDWTVLLDSTPESSPLATISILEPNGTYGYSISQFESYRFGPASGYVIVDGSSVTVPLYADLTFSVTFTETGLPAQAGWSVTLDGHSDTVYASETTFSETNGTYWFTASGSAGFLASPGSGFVSVDGFVVTVSLNFSHPSSPVTPGLGEGLLGLPGYDGLYLLLWNAVLSLIIVVLAVLLARRRPPSGPLVVSPPGATTSLSEADGTPRPVERDPDQEFLASLGTAR
ncbi:MAG: YncE family protein [Thermoplasmata archaeon]